ncbi:Putative flippase GtrA (transmembrane translocase of bactoprenol-linked glucose) [Klenkia soli]|uniref:Putative flippase GtrA (Transmembrane translocase of bactoprenol-linked glucose) n=1 Tax=Klenkia soli TaxID=1052260 RepID=A0A1H0TCE5_9ACTN|nr:GtrA family protein [Klenkia soli]SDP51679.1 Putative flippase GtrA (transmembrane translocase of bactoprenol-linked glucose) [Klenkia soli]
MTCPSLLRRHPAVEVVSEAAEDLRAQSEHRAAHLLQRLRDGDQGGAQFVRFAFVGAISSVLYAVLFVAFDGIGDQPANIVGAIASTLLANELHRRLTFHAGDRVGWFTAQWEGGGLAVVGLVATSVALAGLDQVVVDASWQVQVLLIGAVTGAIGACRFVALRAWVFTSRALQRS